MKRNKKREKKSLDRVASPTAAYCTKHITKSLCKTQQQLCSGEGTNDTVGRVQIIYRFILPSICSQDGGKIHDPLCCE